MIPFNVPPYIGKEDKYIKQAIDSRKICGDGQFTKKCNVKFEEMTGAKKALMTTSGTSELEMAALLADIKPGDEAVMPSYTFVSTANAFVLRGATIVFVDIRPDTMNIDENLIEDAITEKTKVLILPFPNNPTGSIMEQKDLEEIAKVVIEHDILVMTDEIYSALTYKDKHFSIASISGMKERTIYINGFSKAYAMTGWRLGYACAPKEIIKQMTKIHQFAIMCAPTSSQYAAIEAIKNGDEDVKTMRQAYNQRRRFLMDAFKKIGLQCFEPFGAFYVFPCIKEFGLTSEEFATRFLKEEKVALVPGTAFGECGEGYLRISYAYSLDNLKIALSRLERFVKKLREERKL